MEMELILNSVETITLRTLSQLGLPALVLVLSPVIRSRFSCT